MAEPVEPCLRPSELCLGIIRAESEAVSEAMQERAEAAAIGAESAVKRAVAEAKRAVAAAKIRAVAAAANRAGRWLSES